jgi:hypothetical protein
LAGAALASGALAAALGASAAGFSAGAAASAGFASFALASGFALALGAAEAFLPSVRISVMRTRVWSWRWPWLRFEFWRRRFLKTRMRSPRVWATISAAIFSSLFAGGMAHKAIS